VVVEINLLLYKTIRKLLLERQVLFKHELDVCTQALAIKVISD